MLDWVLLYSSALLLQSQSGRLEYTRGSYILV
jgi:hypothetical protein